MTTAPMTAPAAQPRLFEDEVVARERIVAAAREQAITSVTLFDNGSRMHPGLSYWTSYREGKNWGASGPCLDDFEAAVLIGAGVVTWEVWCYDPDGGFGWAASWGGPRVGVA